MHNDQLIDRPLAIDRLNQDQYTGKKLRILNDSSVFYKGLFGMILCVLPGGIIGIVLVKVCFDHAKEALREYNLHPNRYKNSSLRKIKNGKTMAYIGLSVFILEILGFVIYTSL